ncbi:hypothetical protein LMH73_006195 [Vibrio splendidus]|nr:hypothetical protein [Vibrio splendidus]MCC4880744.1 hypothetical protein [Vibrio splendidus]
MINKKTILAAIIMSCASLSTYADSVHFDVDLIAKTSDGDIAEHLTLTEGKSYRFDKSNSPNHVSSSVKEYKFYHRWFDIEPEDEVITGIKTLGFGGNITMKSIDNNSIMVELSSVISNTYIKTNRVGSFGVVAPERTESHVQSRFKVDLNRTEHCTPFFSSRDQSDFLSLSICVRKVE